MIKGVRKYGPEPGPLALLTAIAGTGELAGFWFPHIFSEAVDAANQTGLFADALGVELKGGNHA